MVISLENKIISFSESVHLVGKPEKFPSPFHNKPHLLAKQAAQQLIQYLEDPKHWENHPLYIDLKAHKRIGKMFGVLVVEDSKGILGFLSAFSGKLLGENHYPNFVPPVFDMLDKKGFYVKEEQALLKLTQEIKDLESRPEYNLLIETTKAKVDGINQTWKTFNKTFKIEQLDRRSRKQLAIDQGSLSNQEHVHKEGLLANYAFKAEKRRYKEQLSQAHKEVNVYEQKIKDLKQERKLGSKLLQQKLYAQYQFLNKDLELKNLDAIFNTVDVPPSGSGECAAPKLLHYAFKNDLKPICMAEFWWGRSPSSNQKIQGEFYPSCEEKCRPILKHMLKGIVVQ